MCASLYIDRLVSRFRFILLTLTLAIAALNPMQDASAQSDLAAMNQQVIRLYQSGQKTEAIALAEKTVAIARQRLGADNKVTGILLSQLGNLYRDTGRFADAENALKTAVAILERTGSGPNFELAQALNNLGGVYLNQDMFSDAEKLFQRSLALYDRLPPGKQRNIMRGNGINNLAVLYGTEANAKAENGQTEGADQAYDKMIAMLNEVIPLWSKEFGPTHQNISVLLQNRGEAYAKKNQTDRAEADLRQALALRLKYLPAKHPVIATTQNSLANVLVAEKKFPEAEQLLLSALAIRTEALGPNHPSVARNLIALSQLYAASGNTSAAVEYSRKAIAAVTNHAATETLAVRQQQGAGGLVEQRSSYFIQHVSNLAAAKGADPAPQLGSEALVAAQWAVQSSTAAAVQQLGIRLAAGGDAIARLVRESQDTSALWRDRDKALVSEVSKPAGQQNRSGIAALRQQIAQLEDKQKTLQARIETQFPDYSALSNPKPLDAVEVQKLLGPDEALTLFLSGDKESYVFALTHDAFEWHVIPLSRKALDEKVASFRHGLDVDELSDSIAAGKPVYFNLDLAYELYSSLLGPVEAIIKDKRYLAVVPSGALTSLPFHLLVTEKPAAPPADSKSMPAYRDAAWLLRRQAVTVLPSVASLKALRSSARADHGAKPFIGFGDPLFQNNAPAGKQRGVAKTRAYNEYWTSRGIDRGTLGEALQRLPETADEIKNIAAKLGASPDDIYLGKAASETTVKNALLSNYRVVYFAPHGLVAGQVKGIGEPALVLSLPANPTDADDGLLTSSEVAQLKLNADWVVLSACNTMAGETPGAEALSGLARAFFYAGSRALLVSHWAVASEAATRLTISTFDVLTKDPTIGRAEALRRAMLAYLSDPSDDNNANPAYWGPFSVIGEGTAK
jgi:CHAT domain-containing protein